MSLNHENRWWWRNAPFALLPFSAFLGGCITRRGRAGLAGPRSPYRPRSPALGARRVRVNARSCEAAEATALVDQVAGKAWDATGGISPIPALEVR